jgi:hypothetical protein
MASPVADDLLENPPRFGFACLRPLVGSSLIWFAPSAVPTEIECTRKMWGPDTRQLDSFRRVDRDLSNLADELQHCVARPGRAPVSFFDSPFRRRVAESSYLVDPASSHMLVSKIKPCMSKYKQVCTVKLRMAH